MPQPGPAPVGANASSHQTTAVATVEPLVSRTSGGSWVPPPAEAPHLGIQSCTGFGTISHFPANCKALGDSDNKAIDTSYSYTVTISISPYCMYDLTIR